MKRFSLKRHEKEEPLAEKKDIKSEVEVIGLPPIALQEAKKKEEKPKISIEFPKKEEIKLLATYNFISDNIPITIKIYKKKRRVCTYL